MRCFKRRPGQVWRSGSTIEWTPPRQRREAKAMTPSILAYLATALGYGALAAYFWRTRWASPTASAAAKPMQIGP